MSFQSEFRERQRKIWSAGDWPEVATYIQPEADALVERVGVEPGQDVLDIGTGSGNVALTAAGLGAKTTGVDITPELFDSARARAAEAEVEVEWLEADAMELPFEDHSFDHVLTAFGAIFAPVHQRAADEMVRVARPGATIGVIGWTPEGLNGQFLATLSTAMPPPPPEAQPPILWGSEEHVGGLFAGKGVDLDFEKAMARVEGDFSADGWVAFTEENLGPAVMAKALLESQGGWEEMRPRLVALFEPYEKDGRLQAEAEYLRTIGRV